MRALKALRSIACGERPADGALLGTCRLEWRGREAYGEEAVLEAFRRSPVDLATASTLCTPGGLVWTDGKSALVADVFDERLARLWRVGPGDAPVREPSVAVPFDTDLSQDRRDVLWRAEDHPWLAPEQAPAVEALARRIAVPSSNDHRVRGFVIRAFSAHSSVGLLASIFSLTAGSTRSASFGLVVSLAGSDGETLVADDINPSEWVRRL